jgi:Domain of unknown function (DUF1836).
VGSSNEEYIKQIINSLKRIDYVKPEEIPNIDLYMDQVTTFMDNHLKASKRYEDDKMLTKTMINNYTKNNLLPSPNKKKYSKEHMLLLIFIYYFKNILSINDIQSIFGPLTSRFFNKTSEISLEEIYKEVFSLEQEQIESLTKDVVRKFNKSTESFSDVEDEEDKEFLSTFSFICMLSFDVYVKKMIIERLIDKSVFGNDAKKNADKKTETRKTDKTAAESND